jgi:hypothetical protein
MMIARENQKTMFTRIVRALVIVAVGGLVACSAAPPPCFVQRPALGGYAVLLERQGPAPAGCADFDLFGSAAPGPGPTSPNKWWENLRIDLYTNQLIVFRSDTLPYYNPAKPNYPAPIPDADFISKGTLPVDPTPENGQEMCTVTDFSAIGEPSDPLGLGGAEAQYGIHVTEAKFLNGARYQGSMALFTADVTFGTCTAKYQGIGLTPSAYLGVLGQGTQPYCLTDADCSAFAGPDPSRSLGSGYNADYDVICRLDIGVYWNGPTDPQQGICYTKEGAVFPALKTK